MRETDDANKYRSRPSSRDGVRVVIFQCVIEDIVETGEVRGEQKNESRNKENQRIEGLAGLRKKTSRRSPWFSESLEHFCV